MRRNAVGWLMLVAGTLYLVAAAVGSVLYLRLDSGDTGAGSRLLASIYTTVWMPAVAICLPAALQLFPTGRPINRFWRWFLVVSVVGGVCVTANWVLGTELFDGMGLDDEQSARPEPARGADERRCPPATLLGVAGDRRCAARSAVPARAAARRGAAAGPLAGVGGTASSWCSTCPSAFDVGPPPVPLLTIPLIPLAMTAAVLKYRLYGITLVINRTVVYLALTAALLAGYFGVVYVLSRLIADAGVQQVLAAGAVAVAFAPLRALLQRLVDRLMFGSGSDPYGALAELGRRLQSPMTPEQVLPAVASTVADALKLPYVAVRAGRPGMPPVRTVEQGSPTPTTEEFPLTDHGEEIGTLVVGAPQRGLGGPRRTLLQDLVRQAGPAVHSVVLTEELSASRQRTIAALEDERIRIRRDLHDGLGPALTGVVLKAEAARNLMAPDPARAEQLMTDVSEQTRSAVDDVRRLVYGLRPPALDQQGLSAALQDFVGRIGGNGAPAVELELPDGPPPPRARRRGRRLPHRHRGAVQRRPAQLRRLGPCPALGGGRRSAPGGR